MESIEKANQLLTSFHELVNTKQAQEFNPEDGYKVGVDLGTSSIVLVVLDGKNRPIFGAFEYADVIRDGLVVDYQQSVQIVNRLRVEAEEALGFPLKAASGAIPPGTVGNNKRVVANVIESANMLADQLVDEPTAAALVLDVDEGAVVDVGGGTTGISIFEKGQPIIVEDEPTGGTHMTLVIAGNNKISIEEAEQIKRDPARDRENFIICRPVIQRMANITANVLKKHPTDPIYVVGGASYLTEFEKEFSNYLEQKVYKPKYPQFVTPIGIAMSSIPIID